MYKTFKVIDKSVRDKIDPCEFHLDTRICCWSMLLVEGLIFILQQNVYPFPVANCSQIRSKFPVPNSKKTTTLHILVEHRCLYCELQ